MRSRMGIAALLCAWVFVAGCGTEEPEVGPPSDRTHYPEGPYGTREGDTIANYAFTTLDGETFYLDDHVFKNPHNRVLLLSSVAGWCGPCRQEQPQLKAWHNEYAKRGLIIVEGIFQKNDYAPATLADVEAWQKQYKLPFPVTLDHDFVLAPFYSTDNPSPPLTIVVDVDDMKILKVVIGKGNEQLIESLILANLPR